MTVTTSRKASPVPGSLVRVRGQRWIVGDVEAGAEALIELSSIEDGRYGETLHVVWDVEVDAEVIDAGALPQPVDFDPPATIAAFLDAAHWSSATSADVYHLQAPFRAGAFIEDYQLEPLARALLAPRVNLLLADDVGLGKTIEAGLVTLDLLLRHRAEGVDRRSGRPDHEMARRNEREVRPGLCDHRRRPGFAARPATAWTRWNPAPSVSRTWSPPGLSKLSFSTRTAAAGTGSRCQPAFWSAA